MSVVCRGEGRGMGKIREYPARHIQALKPHVHYHPLSLLPPNTLGAKNSECMKGVALGTGGQ